LNDESERSNQERMMAKQRKLIPLRLWFFRKKGNSKGFTLIELLVALFIGGVIVSLLLFTVVQLLQTNQREAARSDTQREMQMAIDYISRDLREAVFVYDGNCLSAPAPALGLTCPGLTTANYLPDEIAGRGANGDNLPVLAFWRVDPLPQPLVDRCERNAAAIATTTNSANLPAEIVGVPCISRQMYTLVVYSLSRRNEDNWRGKARIKRYQIPQFTFTPTANGTGNPQPTPGWYYPAGQDTNFSRWPLSASGTANLQVGIPTVSVNTPNQVLVDFVDGNGSVSPNNTPASTPACPAPAADYVITPTTATASGFRGFYVCVKGAISNGTLNQEVVVRIQGNAAGRPGIPRDRASVPIPMETRVLVRGVLNKV
jgi:prepilin-type N-terminal cleavage/methylation domain-containing protein